MNSSYYPPDIDSLAKSKQIDEQDDIQEESTSMEEKLESLDEKVDADE